MTKHLLTPYTHECAAEQGHNYIWTPSGDDIEAGNICPNCGFSPSSWTLLAHFQNEVMRLRNEKPE